MKKLVLSALMLAVASQAAGCIIVSDDDDTGNVNVDWRTLTAASNGSGVETNCPASASSATIFALPVGSSGAPFEDRYLCGDGGGTAADLPAGQYDIWVRLTDSNLTTTFAESGSQRVDVVAGNSVNAPLFDIFIDHGFYTVGWYLRPPGGGSLQCSQVAGENGVSVTATSAGGSRLDTTVDCEEGIAPNFTVTRPLPSARSSNEPGARYTFAIDILNAQDQSIGSSQVITPGETDSLRWGNDFGDLGDVDINLR